MGSVSVKSNQDTICRRAFPAPRGWVLPFAAALTLLGACGASSQTPPAPGAVPSPPSPAEILHELRRFRVVGAVLHVAAHPDDENTQLIAYLAHGRALQAGYLSITRGDGGQNLLGPQLGPQLGMARTQELLAARAIDGGRQFFTRAIDYGFSKDYREALRVWGHEQVLGDVVRVVREFRPDVMVTRFSPSAGGTHGHHTASAVLALEAFRLAGDPAAYPEQLGVGKLEPWQPKRIFMNSGASGTVLADTLVRVTMDVGGTDPVNEQSFALVAQRSRAQHRTQGFGQGPLRDAGPGARLERFVLLAGEPASTDIMQGVDTTWARIPGGSAIGRLTSAAIERFDPTNPAASVPALLEIHRAVVALPQHALLDDKRRLLDQILAACLGLSVQTTVPEAEVVAGESLPLTHTAVQTAAEPVRWVTTRYAGGAAADDGARELRANQPATRSGTVTVPAGTPVSQPYWLREPGSPGFYHVADPSLIGRPANPPLLAIEHVFAVRGTTLVLTDRPVARRNGGVRDVEVIAPVALHITPAVGVFPRNGARQVTVSAVAARADLAGTVSLIAPAGWRVEPASQSFRTARAGDSTHLTFTVGAPADSAEAWIEASAQVAGWTYGNQRLAIDYEHIPLQLYQPPASLKAASFDVAIRGRNVGFLPGAGDDVPQALEQLGYAVTVLGPEQLTPAALARFDAVVMGIRAANVRTDLDAVMPALFAYAAAGGTVIEQYSQSRGLRTTQIAPYPLALSQERVTDENARVTLLVPDHPALTSPNRITPADFEGWVQERGTYYAGEWDDRFIPLVASSDEGEPPLRGGLLVGQVGRGYWVYSGLAFFRQLPAGVPGAYRLFANLVSLGKG